MVGQLQILASEPAHPGADSGAMLPQRLLVPWGERINQLRTALMYATVERVTARQVTRERQFDLLLTCFGAVIVAVLESVALLSQRIVGPLAPFGGAISRVSSCYSTTAL